MISQNLVDLSRQLDVLRSREITARSRVRCKASVDYTSAYSVNRRCYYHLDLSPTGKTSGFSTVLYKHRTLIACLGQFCRIAHVNNDVLWTITHENAYAAHVYMLFTVYLSHPNGFLHSKVTRNSKE